MALSPWREGTIRARVEGLLSTLYHRDTGGLVRLIQRLAELEAGTALPGDKASAREFLDPFMTLLDRYRVSPGELRDRLLQEFNNQVDAIDRVLQPAMLWTACEEDGARRDAKALYAVVDGAGPRWSKALFDHATAFAIGTATTVWVRERAPGWTPQTDLPPVLWMTLSEAEDGGPNSSFELTHASVYQLGSPPHLLDPGPPEALGLREVAKRARALGMDWKRACCVGGLPEDVVLVLEIDAPLAALPFAATSTGLRSLRANFLAVAVCPRDDAGRLIGRTVDGPIPPPTKRGPCRMWIALPKTPAEQRAACVGVWATNGIWGAAAGECCPILHGQAERYFAVLAPDPHHLDATIRKVHPRKHESSLRHLMSALDEHTHLLWADARVCPPTT